MTLGLTPSQTAGPFFAIGLPFDRGPLAVPEGTSNGFWIRGVVLDGRGDPVQDAVIETWQAGPDGRYSARDLGFARCPTDDRGGFGVFTVKPGVIHGPGDSVQAPHIEMAVFARGLLKQLSTRMYFADEERANAADPVLSGITDPGARATLVAEPSPDGYRFDIRLQGEGETVFFAF
jgi:protocatechuate 3,4-dioxygenase, alpha subunit